jgi:hypothetical protein
MESLTLTDEAVDYTFSAQTANSYVIFENVPTIYKSNTCYIKQNTLNITAVNQINVRYQCSGSPSHKFKRTYYKRKLYHLL